MRLLAAGVGVLALAAAPASAAPHAPAVKDGGIFRFGTPGFSVQIDPQVAYITTAWWLEYATAAKLYNYPDKRGSAGMLLRPEVASGYTVSGDGKTYTFTIRKGFRFSDGTPLTARHFAYAIDRVANHDLASPGSPFITDPAGTNIVGAKDVVDGRARHVRGVRVLGNKLVIRLTRPDATFLSKITMPFFQATSTKLPLAKEVLEPYPSAGPYYYARHDLNVRTSIRRNPSWRRGPGRQRPRHLTGVDVRWNQHEQTGFMQVLANDLDLAPVPAVEVAGVARRFGVNRTRFWSKPVPCVGFMSFNNEEGLFAENPALRRAVNWAVDRTDFVAQAGLYAGEPWTHLLPPAVPGTITAKRRQPYATRANVERARKLAVGHFRDGKIVVAFVSPASAQAQLLRRDLIRLGFEPENIEMRGYGGSVLHWPPAEWDLIVPGGWCAEYPDPYDFFLIFGADPGWFTTHFESAKYEKKIAAAARLTGNARFKAFGELDLELMRDAAPLAPMRTYNSRSFFSNRVDPRSLVWQGIYSGWSIPALALK